MLNIALVTHAYAESESPAGLSTAALAHAFTARGHRIHVIAARNTVPRPRHESKGTLTIHRLEQRRGSPIEAFALNATRRLFELGITGEFDVVECIDAPSCITAIASLRACVHARFGLVSVQADPAAQLDPHCAAANGLADAVIRCHETGEVGTSTPVIPLPLVEHDRWHPPKARGPAFIACDAFNAETKRFLTDAFRASDAYARGWSLLLHGEDGRWARILGEQPGPEDPRRIPISTSPAVPIGPMHALDQGHLCIVDDRSPLRDHLPSYPSGDSASLTQELNQLSDLTQEELATRASLVYETLGPRHDAAAVATAHEDLWKNLRPGLFAAQAAIAWRSLEQSLSHRPIGA